MPRTIDFSKLKKDDLLKKIGSKLTKDELVQLAQGLHTGSLSASAILGAPSGDAVLAQQTDAAYNQ